MVTFIAQLVTCLLYSAMMVTYILGRVGAYIGMNFTRLVMCKALGGVIVMVSLTTW